jgi:hypothetical protein
VKYEIIQQHKTWNMINKIKEMRRSMNATPKQPNKSQQHGALEDPNQKDRTGRKAEHGQDNHINDT